MVLITKLGVLALLGHAFARSITARDYQCQYDTIEPNTNPFTIPSISNFSTSDVDIANKCSQYFDYKLLRTGQSLSILGSAGDGKILAYNVTNNCYNDWPIGTEPCTLTYLFLRENCGYGGDFISASIVINDCVEYGLAVGYWDDFSPATQVNQARDTSGLYCNGGNGISIAEFFNLSDHICLVLNGKTLAAGQSVGFMTTASYGALQLRVTNNADQPTVIDSKACQVNYQTIGSVCSPGSNFTVGDISSEGGTSWYAAIIAHGAVGGRDASTASSVSDMFIGNI